MRCSTHRTPTPKRTSRSSTSTLAAKRLRGRKIQRGQHSSRRLHGVRPTYAPQPFVNNTQQGAIPMSSRENKISIVFVHGLWADGSCFSKLIPALQAEGHEVIAAQYGLDSHAADVAAVKSSLRRVSAPVLLV